MPPLPTPEMADREARRALFMEELIAISAQQVVARDLEAIANCIRLNPEGGWSDYAGEDDGSTYKVHDVEFLQADGELPDRYRVVFKFLNEASGAWEFAREDLILLEK